MHKYNIDSLSNIHLNVKQFYDLKMIFFTLLFQFKNQS